MQKIFEQQNDIALGLVGIADKTTPAGDDRMQIDTTSVTVETLKLNSTDHYRNVDRSRPEAQLAESAVRVIDVDVLKGQNPNQIIETLKKQGEAFMNLQVESAKAAMNRKSRAKATISGKIGDMDIPVGSTLQSQKGQLYSMITATEEVKSQLMSSFTPGGRVTEAQVQ